MPLFSYSRGALKTAPSIFLVRTLAFFALMFAANATAPIMAQNESRANATHADAKRADAKRESAARVLDVAQKPQLDAQVKAAAQSTLQSAARSTAQTATQTPTRARQGNARLATLEANLIARVNATRRGLKLSTLRHDLLLAEVARAHSLEMRDKKYFAHESPTAGLVNPLDRYRAGFRNTPAIIAENIYRAWSTARAVPSSNDISRAHNALMKSPGHRKNIVEPRVTNIGVGIVQNANGDIWITQMFSRPTW